MKYNQEIHNRRSIRLKEYDYTSPGAYFVTICTHNRECILGEINNFEMRLSEYGKIVRDEWLKSSDIRREIKLNEYIIMPNHLHMIVFIIEDDDRRGERPFAPTMMRKYQGCKSKSIGSFIAGFKSAATKRINKIRQTPGISVWQRNYYEHIIRNDDDLNQIREYIVSNPLLWEKDENNPNKINP